MIDIKKYDRVAFFGDSLIEGVTNEYRRTTDTWCKIASDRYGWKYDKQ